MSHLTLIAKGTLPLFAAASICSGADFTANPNKSDAVQVGGVAGIPCGTASVTQSTDPVTITALNSVSCNAGGLHTDNSYYRVFDSSKWGEGTFTVCAVEIGVETAFSGSGSQPIDVIIYDSNDINNLGTPVYTENVSVTDQDMTLLNIPITGAASVSTGLIVEIFTPNGQDAGNSFFIGSNANGEDSPSYLAAADCGVVAPTPTGDIGFPQMQIVMTVYGDAGCVIGNCLGDTNFDGVVNVTDLVNVINGWGTDGLQVPGVISDTNCDGIVDVTDLVIGVINNWGVCPAKNDECEDRINAVNGDNPYTNLGASTNDADPAFECTSFGTNDIWYNYTATCTGELTISLCDSDFDTVLQLYSGFDCPPASPIDCNDDSANCEDLQSQLTLAVVAGDEIKIRIGGWDGDAGSGIMNIDCVAAVNDDCEDRLPIGEGDFPFSNIDATTDGPTHAACDFFGDPDVGSDVWYNYTATVTGSVSINTCLTGFDTKIAVYGDCDCGNLTDENLLGCNDDFCGLQSQVIIDAVAGNCYKVRVGGFGGAQGEGILTIVEILPGACCFEDGSCEDGTNEQSCAKGGGVFQGFGTVCTPDLCEDQTGACCFPDATCVEDTPTNCALAGGIHQGPGTNCDPNLCEAICGGPNSGPCDVANGTPGCDDTECCLAVCAIDSFCCDVEWDGICAGIAGPDSGGVCDPNPGACCFTDGSCEDVAAAACVNSGGTFQGVGTACIDTICPILNNDLCEERRDLDFGSTPFTNIGATFEGPDPGCGLIGSDIWYNFTAAEDGAVVFDTFGSEFDTVLAAYFGCDCPADPATLIDCNDDSGSLQSELVIGLLAGDCVKIQLGGFAGSQGNGVVNVTLVEPGACCFRDGTCEDGTLPDDCAGLGGIFQGFGTVCVDGLCPDLTGQCCLPSGECVDDTPTNCASAGGTHQGAGTDCATGIPCVPTCGDGAGGCFEANGTPGCEDVACCKAVCAMDSFCCDVEWDQICADIAVVTCSTVEEACCLGDGTCIQALPADCIASGGTPAGIVACDDAGCPQPPANDNCDSREAIVSLVTPFSNLLATTDGAPDALCDKFGDDDIASDIWFNYTPCTDGDAVISLCGSGYDTKMAVYDGCECPTGPAIACNDDTCALQSEVALTVTGGNCYKIRIGGFGGAQGEGTINITGPDPCGGGGAGACCYPSGGCLELTENQCAVSKGEFLGDGTECAANKQCPNG